MKLSELPVSYIHIKNLNVSEMMTDWQILLEVKGSPSWWTDC